MSEAPGSSNNTSSPSDDDVSRIPVEDERTSDNVKKCPQKRRGRRSRPDDESLERVKERGGTLVIEFDGERSGRHLQPSNDPPEPNDDAREPKSNENENEHSKQNVPNQVSSDEEECQGAQSIAPRHEDLHNLPGPSNAASPRKLRKRESTPSKSSEDSSESDTSPKQLPSPRKKLRASIPKVPCTVREVDSGGSSPDSSENSSLVLAVDSNSSSPSNPTNGSDPASEDDSNSIDGSNPVSEDDSKSIDGSNPVSEDDSKSIDGSNPVSEDDSSSDDGSKSPVSESNSNSSRPVVPSTPRKKY